MLVHYSSVLDDRKTIYCFILSSPSFLFMLVVFFVNNTLGEEDVLEMEVTVSNESVQVQHEIEPPESLGDDGCDFDTNSFSSSLRLPL